MRAVVAYSEQRAYQEPGQSQLGRRNGATAERAARLRPPRVLAVQAMANVAVIAVAVSRYLRATATWPGQAAVPPEKASVSAGSSTS
jgi:hypothetical protein